MQRNGWRTALPSTPSSELCRRRPMLLLLSGSLFLGWSLGANHGGNLFGPAVGARMIRFTTAAALCSVLVVAGAVLGGAGTTATLSSVGTVTTPGGAFVIALAASSTITLMSKFGLPISTSQAVIGAIVGWNAFAHAPTGFASLAAIVAAWVIAPCISAAVAATCYVAARGVLQNSMLHLLTIDAMTRAGLVAVTAFGAYSLGANNIANVVGMFADVAPFHPIMLAGLRISPAHQLFLVGGLAMATGILTYSHRVVHTVGSDLLKLSPVAALVVLFAHGLVLFVFSSQELGRVLHILGLPGIPLVPISSSQAITGAVLGIGLVKRARGLRIRVLRDIAIGWVTAPVLACVVCFGALFIARNVFELKVMSGPPTGQIAPARIPTGGIRLPVAVQAASSSFSGVRPTFSSPSTSTRRLRRGLSVHAPREPAETVGWRGVCG